MEDDRQYEYDGPDSKQEPVPEEPADVGLEVVEKEPEAADGELAEHCGEPDGGSGQRFCETGEYQEDCSRQYEEWTHDGYQQAPWQQTSGQNGYYQEEYRQAVNSAYNQPKRQSSMALASLIMGIIGIVTSCCCYGGLILGSLGIIFALLSKVGDTMEGYAKAGLVTSIIALVLAVLAMIFLFGMMSFSILSGGVY